VIQLVNDYEYNVFNGDLGVVRKVISHGGADKSYGFTVEFSGARQAPKPTGKGGGTGATLSFTITN